MGMVYRWKEASSIRSISAQQAGEELERIRTFHNGRLNPAIVVDKARPANAPLHPCFEWDDRRAAEAYRVDQAKHIIRSVEVIIEESDEQPKATRAFVSVVREDDRSYTSIAHAMSVADLRDQVVDEALKALEAWRKRYAELDELADIFAVIDQARGAK
jgi:hypothetical protein